MNENFELPAEDNEQENLKDENEFLKMKLMLEQGAKFGNMKTDGKLPAEIENQFLKNIIEFEKQFEERKAIKVFDKIQKPTRFKPVNEIPDDEIDDAWDELNNYLNKYNIDLAVCSPNINNRELYRFATEELFNHEMDDMNVPGMMSCFTYDEFYPDYKYDNTRYATDDCIGIIFNKRSYDWMPWLKSENLSLNNNTNLTQEEFKQKINRFKEVYEDIITNEINAVDCSIDEKSCHVKGIYDVTMKLDLEEIVLKGNWLVEFVWDGDYWEIINVQIDGINF